MVDLVLGHNNFNTKIKTKQDIQRFNASVYMVLTMKILTESLKKSYKVSLKSIVKIDCLAYLLM